MKLSLSERTLPPIEVEVHGVTYPVKPITRKVQRELHALQARITSGDGDAIYEQMPILLDLPEAVLETLEFRQVLQIVKHVTTALYAPFSGVSGEEKNASAPGPTP
jgi:hypothetical protein